MSRERGSPSQSTWLSFYMRKKVALWPDTTTALVHARIVSPWTSWGWLSQSVYSYFEKGCQKKNEHATIQKGNMGYYQYTVPDTVAVKPTFVAFLKHSQTYVHCRSCQSFKFLIVACTFSDDLSRNSCIWRKAGPGRRVTLHLAGPTFCFSCERFVTFGKEM